MATSRNVTHGHLRDSPIISSHLPISHVRSTHNLPSVPFADFKIQRDQAGPRSRATCQHVNFWSHATDSICFVQGSTFSFNISTVTLCTSNHSFLNRLRLSAVPSGHIAILHLFDRSCLIDSQPYLSHSLMGYPLLNGLPLSLVPPSLGVVKRG